MLGLEVPEVAEDDIDAAQSLHRPSLYLARLTRPNAGAIVGSRIDH